jgi:hypothetical protein
VADADDLRVSDEQRDRAAQEIREHYAAGRLTDDELSDRVQAAYTARTEQELRRLLSDLPKLPASPAQQKAELAARRSALQRRMLLERELDARRRKHELRSGMRGDAYSNAMRDAKRATRDGARRARRHGRDV